MIIDGDNAYTTATSGDVVRVALPDGPAAMHGTTPTAAFEIALAGSDLIISHLTSTELHRVPLSGGTGTPISGLVAGIGAHIAVSGNTVYWTDDGLRGVYQSDLSSPAPQTLATDQAAPTEIVLDATHVYWIDRGSDAAIRRVELSGGTAEDIATSLDAPAALAVGDEDLCWVAADGVWRVAKAGGTPTNLAPITDATAVTFDGANVYFAGTGRIHKVSKSGEGLEEIAHVIGYEIRSIALHGDQVYWLTVQDAAVWRAPK
jgi:hypothetical protein